VLRRPLESAQYVSIKYTERLTEAGVEPSVGSVGDSFDNALAEIINGLYKTEVIRRLLESIGGIPPAEAEARYYAQIEGAAMAA
jgi:transposase InsO family protein